MKDMNCPFCGKKMQDGEMTGDGRSRLVWNPREQKVPWLERLAGKGRITAARYRFGTLKIDSYYCGFCRKMIFDTDVRN